MRSFTRTSGAPGRGESSTCRSFKRRIRSGEAVTCACAGIISAVSKQTVISNFVRKLRDCAWRIRVSLALLIMLCGLAFVLETEERNILDARYLLVNRLAPKCIQGRGLNSISAPECGEGRPFPEQPDLNFRRSAN